MIELPPGDPVTIATRPKRSYAIVGAIDERGRLPPCTRLATTLPSIVGSKEKSVSSLFSMNPPAVMSRLPNWSSIDVVMATALP